MPPIMPPVADMVTTAGLLLLQVPPEGVHVLLARLPQFKVEAPTIAPAVGAFTVTIFVDVAVPQETGME
jgi:hypothetical protein